MLRLVIAKFEGIAAGWMLIIWVNMPSHEPSSFQREETFFLVLATFLNLLLWTFSI